MDLQFSNLRSQQQDIWLQLETCLCKVRHNLRDSHQDSKLMPPLVQDTATSFYRRHGFRQLGEPKFEIKQFQHLLPPYASCSSFAQVRIYFTCLKASLMNCFALFSQIAGTVRTHFIFFTSISNPDSALSKSNRCFPRKRIVIANTCKASNLMTPFSASSSVVRSKS